MNLGSIYAQTKNFSKASELWSKAIKINPKIPDVHNNLAMIEITLKNYDKAIEYAQNAIKLNPNFFLAFNNLGIAQKEKGMRMQNLLFKNQFQLILRVFSVL